MTSEDIKHQLIIINRCDVMNIMWRKTEMEQKSDRERWGDGAEGKREREGKRVELWNTDSRGEKKREEKLDLGKGGLPIPTIPRDEWENRSTPGGWGGGGVAGGTLVGCSANPVILINDNDNSSQREREREREAHIHSHTIVQAYVRTNSMVSYSKSIWRSGRDFFLSLISTA